MSITMSGLYHADVGRVLGSADRWTGLIRGVDDAVEDLVAGTRDLHLAWSGPGAQAAWARNHTLQVRVGNASRYLVAVRDAVLTFADELSECHRLLHELIGDAEARGLEIDFEAGRMRFPQAVDSDDAGPHITLAGITVDVDGYNVRIDQLVARVNEADQAASDIVNHSILGDWELPGTEIDDESDQILIADTITWEPAGRARWWQSLHQLTRDQLIATFPEIIGAGEGWPTAVRDAANRLLLQREKDELLNRQAQLDQQLGQAPLGAAGLAAVRGVTDARLIEIAALEERLADPGARLLGRQPDLVGKAEPQWDDYPG